MNIDPGHEAANDEDSEERAARSTVGAGFVAYPLDEAIADAHDPKHGHGSNRDDSDPGNHSRPGLGDDSTDFNWNIPGHTDDGQDDPDHESLQQRRTRLLRELDALNGQLGYPAAGQAAQTGNPASASVSQGSQLATVTPSDSSEIAPAHSRDSDPPESVADSLAGLPRWQQRYVLALYELGGIEALACNRCKLNARGVHKHQKASADFRAACEAAVDHTTDLVVAAAFKGATVGDLVPVYQGGIRVGFKRVRNTADAKLILELRGKLGQDASMGGKQSASAVAPVATEAVPAIVAAVTARLFAGNRGRPVKTIDAESGKVVDT